MFGSWCCIIVETDFDNSIQFTNAFKELFDIVRSHKCLPDDFAKANIDLVDRYIDKEKRITKALSFNLNLESIFSSEPSKEILEDCISNVFSKLKNRGYDVEYKVVEFL